MYAHTSMLSIREIICTHTREWYRVVVRVRCLYLEETLFTWDRLRNLAQRGIEPISSKYQYHKRLHQSEHKTYMHSNTYILHLRLDYLWDCIYSR